MDASFFTQGAPDPMADPTGYQRQQKIAQMLSQQGMQSPQGQMAGNQFVAPGVGAYANQLASALMGGAKTMQLRDAARASNILNGGTGVPNWMGAYNVPGGNS